MPLQEALWLWYLQNIHKCHATATVARTATTIPATAATPLLATAATTGNGTVIAIAAT